MRLPKRERERGVFEVLAPLAGLHVVPGSILQPDPPDIVCEVVGHGSLAVELVALDAPETRSRLDNMLTTEEAWGRALATWPADNQARLLAETADVFFSIGFGNQAGLRDRTKALRALQDFLLHNPGHSSVVPLSAIGRPPGINSATIHRGHVTHGPRFSHFSAGRWLPPQVSKVEQKLRPSRYKSDIPLELFAYAIHDEPDLGLDSLEQLQKAIVELLPGSAFRRAHVFDFGLRRHLYSHPA